jgi:hypothetical protein
MGFQQQNFLMWSLLALVAIGVGFGVIFSSSVTLQAQPTTEAACVVNPEFVFESGAIVTHGLRAEWDGVFVNPGGVIFHDGQFHMFRNGFHNWPGDIRVGYMTSPDGVNWTEPQNDPVFLTTQVPYANPGADVSSVIPMDDGTWVAYFHTVNFGLQDLDIGRATAPSPLGPWTPDPEPVLSPGGPGEWDSRSLSWPSVNRADDGGFVMFYGGRNQLGNQSRIGMATSPDGITWTKYNDASTSDEFSESDPVYAGEPGWDSAGVDRPEVQHTPDGWVMMYQGSNQLNNRGLAFSQDGISWTQHSDNPILTGQGDFPTPGTTWDTALVFNEGKYYYYMEIGNLSVSNFTDIYLGVHDGLFCSSRSDDE